MRFLKHKEKLEDLSLKDIEDEIKARHELISQMVGTLYPNILYNEIEQLREFKNAKNVQSRTSSSN